MTQQNVWTCVLAAALAGVGCGGSGQGRASVPATAPTSDSKNARPAARATETPSEPEPETRGESTSKPPPVPEDYELGPADCVALADHYYDVILKEQTGAIPGKLKEPERNRAELNAERNAEEGKSQWERECEALVGKSFARSRIDCGMKATTVKGFTGCVTGAAEPKVPSTP